MYFQHIVKRNWCVVNLLHAYTQVASINLSIDHNPIAMQVTVDVALEPLTYAVWVKGNMRQDELIHKHANAMNLLESCLIIVLIPENVMVSTDKDFPPIQTLHCFQMASGDYYIPKMIYCILRTNCLVPVFYHGLVHILGRGERTKRFTVLQRKLLPRVRVTKMGITD